MYLHRIAPRNKASVQSAGEAVALCTRPLLGEGALPRRRADGQGGWVSHLQLTIAFSFLGSTEAQVAVPGAPREQQLYCSAHGQARPARAHPHATLPTPCFAGLECGLSSSQPFAPAPGSRPAWAGRHPGSRLEGDRIPERRRAAGTYLGPPGTRTMRRTAARPPAAGAAR